MRILLFTDADVFAGTERHMLDLALALREAGHVATLACPRGAALEKRAKVEGLPILAIEKGGLLDWRAIRVIARRLRSGKFDIVHAHNGRTHLSTVMATLMARRGVAVFTQHFITPGHTLSHGWKARLFSGVHRFVNARTRRFIAISNAVKASIAARDDAPLARIHVVYNGIGDPLQTSLEAPEKVRARYGVSATAPLVVCAARLQVEKDHESLLSAWVGVQRDLPAARLLLAGEGELQAELQARIEAAGIAPSVQLMGFVEDAFSLINAADVFVLSSPAEAFGLVFLEAMGLSKPIVACDRGAAPEIVTAGECGLLVPPCSPVALEAALLRLLRDSEFAQQLGRAGKERFRLHFTRQQMAESTLEVYRKALQIGGSS